VRLSLLAGMELLQNLVPHVPLCALSMWGSWWDKIFCWTAVPSTVRFDGYSHGTLFAGPAAAGHDRRSK